MGWISHLVIAPPLIITEAEIDAGVGEVLDGVLGHVGDGLDLLLVDLPGQQRPLGPIAGAAVSDNYERPFQFTGRSLRVTVDLVGVANGRPGADYQAALGEQ